MARLDESRLSLLAARVSQLTGERFHSYTSNPGNYEAPRVVFCNGKVCLGYAEAVAYASAVLAHLRDRGVSADWKRETEAL